MRGFLLRCGPLVLALVARTADAAPCAPGSLQNYIDLGATGCSAAGVLLASFTTAPGQSFATPLDPGTVQVTPTATPGGPALVLTFSSNASAGELLETFFRFQASAPALLAGGLSIAGASATGDGVVTATQDACAGGLFAGGTPIGCSGAPSTIITFVAESDSTLADEATFASTGFVDVFTDIALDGGLGGSASLGSVTLSLTAVPEPSTGALVALGLGVLARSQARRRP